MRTKITRRGGEEWGATFSDCGQYRYRLWREWDKSLPRAVFCLMNPSTADENVNDPTVEKQYRRVLQWADLRDFHIGRLDIVNVFAYRETYSTLLSGYLASGIDLVGPENDEAILTACHGAEIVVCGWGEVGMLAGRGNTVLKMLRDHGIVPNAIRVNNDGSPTHPGRLSYVLPATPIFSVDLPHPKMA